MAGSGRISLLVSKDLQTLTQAVKQIPREVAAQIRKHTRTAAEPIWQESVRGHVTTRLETRVLADSAKVAASDQNVTLKSAAVGKMSSGTPKSVLAFGTEFGADAGKQITTRSKNGKQYTRRRGPVFKPPRRNGYVVYPAAKDSIPRLASLWVQTAIRTIHEQFEKGGVS